jgi:hypothetical protein
MLQPFAVKGLEKTLKTWENRRPDKAPYFAIFCKKMPLMQYSGKSVDDAEERITKFFEDMAGTEGTGEIFEFRIYETGKPRFEYKDTPHSVFYFTVSETAVLQPSAVNIGAGANNYFLQTISGEISALRSEIAALKSEKIEEEEEEPEETETGIGQVNTLLSNPVVAGLIAAVTEKLFGVKEEKKIITNLSGVPDTNEAERAAVYQYVEILLQKGVKPVHLKKLADMPAAKIKSLLLML